MLTGKKALIFGVANHRSLAWEISKELKSHGARIGLTYASENLKKRVEPLSIEISSDFCKPCDITSHEELDEVFNTVKSKWGTFDILIHSIAFADRNDLEGKFINTKKEGFLKAIEISAYSLIELARRSEKLMEEGRILTLSYYGSQKVVKNYNVMGVAKSALESSVRYLAHDLGDKKITVNTISAGPVKTLAASGIRDFRSMLSDAKDKTPLKENIDPKGIGKLASFLCSDGGKHITGSIIYIDSGAHIMA